jgi:serine protease Do
LFHAQESEMRNGTGWSRISVAVIGAALLSGCTTGYAHPGERIAAADTGTQNASAVAKPRATRLRDLPDITALVESWGPAVVNVSVVKEPDAVTPEQAALEELLRRFGLVPHEEEPRGPVRGTASGFIVSSDGYVLTNAHVVREASVVTIKLTDRRELPAKLIGADLVSDIAVLKIDARNLPVVRFGNPARLKPGQWVVAIGSPFGFENSVTVGVVSGTARSLPGGGYVPFIQTDVAVNPGNSGGPLFNLNGEVVGINSQILSRSGGYMGMSFAVPIDVARDVQQQLIKTGRVIRGRIGVIVQDMNAQLVESFGLDRPRGALVSEVEPGGPAEEAGIKPGDIILEVDKVRIDYSGDLSSLIAGIKPGTAARLAVWRDRGRHEFTVHAGEMNEPAPRIERSVPEADEAVGALGLSLRPLTPEQGVVLRTKARLFVTDVSGAAALAGVQAGDLVLAINGTPVANMRELHEVLTKSGKVAAILIQREDQQFFVPIELEAPKPDRPVK